VLKELNMKFAVLVLGCLLTTSAQADWYYRVMKVVCGKNELRVIDYSAPGELGEARGKERGAIDVDTLSTWKTTANELNVPDKPLPHIEICKIPSGKYKVTLTNAGGGYSAPYAVVNVVEITNPQKPMVLIDNLHLNQILKKRYEIVFSKDHPEGLIINE
jgi:hypothetical protein